MVVEKQLSFLLCFDIYFNIYYIFFSAFQIRKVQNSNVDEETQFFLYCKNYSAILIRLNFIIIQRLTY